MGLIPFRRRGYNECLAIRKIKWADLPELPQSTTLIRQRAKIARSVGMFYPEVLATKGVIHEPIRGSKR